jgi:hypothetical protein
MVFLPPIPIPTEGTREEKVRMIAQRFADIIAETIRVHPEQWGVFYPFWDVDWKPE